MSEALSQHVDSPDEFGTGKRGTAARWIAELKMAEKDSLEFQKRGKLAEARYMDEGRSTAHSVETFNIFWSNVQTLKPAIYATPPKPVVQRRYLDADPVGRAASTILQRAITTMVEQTSWHEVTDQAVQDYLIPGRGTTWARYEPHFTDAPAGAVQQQAAEVEAPEGEAGAEPAPDSDGDPDDDGLQITDDAEGQVITYEEVCWDYVHWQDFFHSPARTWQSVRWVARRVLMTQDEGVERFGAMFRAVPLMWRPDGLDNREPAYQLFARAPVYEIWDKPSRKVIWICPDYGDEPLDERDDPLGLTEFFPCPRPLYATLSNSSLMPAPDLKMYQDQADELSALTARIAALARAIKATGVYDAAAEGIQRVFQESSENELIPVEGWAQFAQAGGFKGSVDFLPLEQFVIALRQLIEVREQTKRDLYEITGIADIVRGQGQASATATAERLKGQFAQLRLRSRMGDVARFCRDMVRITGEVIAKHFQPQTLLLLSDYQQTTGADPQTAMAAIALLKNDQVRGFRIEIEVDSTVVADQHAEQEGRVAFLQMAGQFLAQAVPLAQQVPELGELAGQMLLFGVRGFPVGREMESVFETALEQLAQASKQPRPPPPPDPALVKVQADAQMQQAEMAQRSAEEQAKLQAQQQSDAQTAALEAAKLQIEQQRLDLEHRKQTLAEQQQQADANNAAVEQGMKMRGMDIEERGRALEQQQQGVEAVAGAMAQIQQQLDALSQAVQAPREVAFKRGDDGKVSGALSKVAT